MESNFFEELAFIYDISYSLLGNLFEQIAPQSYCQHFHLDNAPLFTFGIPEKVRET